MKHWAIYVQAADPEGRVFPTAIILKANNFQLRSSPSGNELVSFYDDNNTEIAQFQYTAILGFSIAPSGAGPDGTNGP